MVMAFLFMIKFIMIIMTGPASMLWPVWPWPHHFWLTSSPLEIYQLLNFVFLKAMSYCRGAATLAIDQSTLLGHAYMYHVLLVQY